jgi:succinyl-diaminopimelate desuccinylase
MHQALFERIDGQREALVDLARGLIRIPTVNPPGDAYDECARHLGERLAQRGFAVTYLRAEGAHGDSDRHPRQNVIARIEGSGPGPCVHFNGHLDVVDPASGWTLDPFAGTLRDGRLYGRGACDMKGGIAAAVIAIESILEAGIPFAGALEISGTADEETGGLGGVAWLAERGWFSAPRVDHVIIPEPLNVDRICLGHRGVWWAEIETFGRAAHGSMPFLGDCAVRHMGALLERIERRLLPRLAERVTAMPVVPADARRSTLNIAALPGGLGESHGDVPSPMVPHRCRMLIDRRFLIEEDLSAVKAEMRTLLDELKGSRAGFDYGIRDVLEVLPAMTPQDAPVVRALQAGIEEVLQRPADLVASPGTYDQKHIYRVGKLEHCVAYGPGILELAHQPDEYVVIDDLVASAKVMAAAALSLLGAAPS